MDATTKLATFLRSAANGELDEVPPGLAQGLRVLLTVKRGMLEAIAEAPAADVDAALVNTARLALSLRSDELDELTMVETAVLDELLGKRRDELERGLHRPADELEAIERVRGGIVLGVDY